MSVPAPINATVPNAPLFDGAKPLQTVWHNFFVTMLSRTGGAPGTDVNNVKITSEQITDASPIGLDVLTAPDEATAREAIGAGTSDLTLEDVATGLNGGDAFGTYSETTDTWALTLNPTGVAPGIYTSVTVDAKGRVTAGSGGGAAGGFNYGFALALGL
jgi:hypothetical protein